MFSTADRRPRFMDPLSAPMRSVVLEPLFRRSASLLSVDPHAPDWLAQIRGFRPAVVAGRLDMVLHLADHVAPTHAIVILTGDGERCLTEEERDALWNACRLPVFEQVITESGRLVAWECEAHEGLHLAEGAQVPEGCAVQTGVCGCGANARRVLDPRVAPSFTAERFTLPPLRSPYGESTTGAISRAS